MINHRSMQPRRTLPACLLIMMTLPVKTQTVQLQTVQLNRAQGIYLFLSTTLSIVQ